MFYDLFSSPPLSGLVADLLMSTREEIVGPVFTNISTENCTWTMNVKKIENDAFAARIRPCEPVIINCVNYDDLQSFTTPCGNFTAQCGPQVETYFDPYKYISSESLSMPSISMPSISMPSLSMPSISMPSISMPSISMPSIPSESLRYYTESLNDWLWPKEQEPERIICDWNDVSCLYNEVNECVNAESASGWAQCLLDSAKQYQEDNDISNQQVAIVAGLGIIAAVTAYKTLSWLYHRKPQEVIALGDDDFDYDLNSAFKN